MTNGLQKILTELKAEKPRIDYVIGILETLIELESGPHSSVAEHSVVSREVTGSIPVEAAKEEPKDEGAILDAQTKARIEAVKAMAEKSTEIA